MAEYLIQGDTLINIADKIRVLSGTEGALSLDDMAVTLETTNVNLDNKLNTQSGLIDQIQTALEGKAAATGGGSVETTTVTINGTANRIYLTVYENGEITAKTGLAGILGNTLTNVVRGSVMVVRSQDEAVSAQNATQIHALKLTAKTGEEEHFVAFSVN